MKNINKIIFGMLALLPLTLFAHPGHTHTGSVWGNIAHFLTTNIYFVIPFIVGTYFFFRYLKTSKIKK